MGKPSIFNSDYQRIMRRRKMVYRTVIILFAVAVIFVTYNKSSIPNLKKVVDNVKISMLKSADNSQKSSEKDSKGSVSNTGSSQDSKQGANAQAGSKKPDEASKQPEPAPVQVTQGEFVFKLPNDESLSLNYEKKDNDIRFTGIKPDNNGISFDIRDDGKAIVFDNPKSSDVWIFNADGSSLKLNPDNYKEYGKAGIMEQYDNKYVWAIRPKFLKDGRIVYQSNLPWFKDVNSYYIWVVNSDGSDNRMCMSSGQTEPIKYQGYTNEGKLIVEYGGSKYTFNTEDRSKQKIE